MTEQHPLEKARITRDRDETGDYLIIHDASPNHPAKPDSSLVERVAQWGYEQRGEVKEAKLQQARDQELEACCEAIKDLEWFEDPRIRLAELRATRRPKPPTLAEKALEQYDRCVSILEEKGYSPAGCIRAALERLKQVEDSND